MDMVVEPFSWHVLLTTWHPNAVWDILLVLAIFGYFLGIGLARRRGIPSVPVYRMVAFVAAMLVTVVALNTAIDTYSDVLFWVHMVQHLLLIMVVPALLIVGGPLTVLVAATRGPTQGRVRGVLLSTPVGVVTHPLIGTAIYAVVIVATHLTSFMNQMMLHPWLHQAEHVMYLLGGYVFLLPLLGNEPIRWRPPYLMRLFVLFVAMAPETVVGIVLLQADHELFPAYANVMRDWGPTPLHDLNRGGGIMWAFGDGLMMVFIVAVMVVYLAHSATNATAGGWLEGVRRNTLAANLEASGEQTTLDDSDLDDDDSALAAYNRMLARLNKQDGERPASR